MTVGSATANLLLTDSNTKILQNPRIRATDAQKATMKIGSQDPHRHRFLPDRRGRPRWSARLVNTQFQYQDVGVNIEMTPTVHYDHDVTLKIKIEVTAQSGESDHQRRHRADHQPARRGQVIRLREGEASILGGIQENRHHRTWNGIPGLSSIPILKYMFGSKDHTIKDDEIVFLVVPHVVRSQSIEPANLRTIDTGAGQSIECAAFP